MSAKRKPKHVIAEIHYAPDDGPSRLRCGCGARFDAATPNDLYDKWTAHAPIRRSPDGSSSRPNGKAFAPVFPVMRTYPRCGVEGCEVRIEQCVYHRAGTARVDPKAGHRIEKAVA